MKCPKCGSPVGDHDARCGSCGAELYIETALADKLFSSSDDPFPEDKGSNIFDKLGGGKKKKKKKAPPRPSHGDAAPGMTFERLRVPIIILCAVIILILLIMLVLSLRGKKGQKLAEKASAFIGADCEAAETKLDEKFKGESAFKGLTSVIEYNRVCESEDDVRIDGVTYPEWAVLLTVDEEDRVLTVRYVDFKLLKKNIKGEKKSRIVNLDKFSPGASRKDVDAEIDMDIYSITYTKDGYSEIYRYYYENDNGDEQPVVLSVNFDNDGKYVSYSSVPIFHQYM